jgi:hypothetical protein
MIITRATTTQTHPTRYRFWRVLLPLVQVDSECARSGSLTMPTGRQSTTYMPRSVGTRRTRGICQWSTSRRERSYLCPPRPIHNGIQSSILSHNPATSELTRSRILGPSPLVQSAYQVAQWTPHQTDDRVGQHLPLPFVGITVTVDRSSTTGAVVSRASQMSPLWMIIRQEDVLARNRVRGNCIHM